MKKTVKALLTTLINDIEDEYSPRTKLIDGEKIVKRINNILDYLMDIPEERTKEDIKIGLVDLSEVMSPGEIEDMANHIARATMEVQKKCTR